MKVYRNNWPILTITQDEETGHEGGVHYRIWLALALGGATNSKKITEIGSMHSIDVLLTENIVADVNNCGTGSKLRGSAKWEMVGTHRRSRLSNEMK